MPEVVSKKVEPVEDPVEEPVEAPVEPVRYEMGGEYDHFPVGYATWQVEVVTYPSYNLYRIVA